MGVACEGLGPLRLRLCGLSSLPTGMLLFPPSVYYFRPRACRSICFSSGVTAHKTTLIPDAAPAGRSPPRCRQMHPKPFFHALPGPAPQGRLQLMLCGEKYPRNRRDRGALHWEKAAVAFSTVRAKQRSPCAGNSRVCICS